MKYVGARYMPKFDENLWDITTSYEALTVVDNGAGTTYVSNKPVPAGIPLTNTEYWAVYGASSGAILDLQTRMGTAENDIDSIEDTIHGLSNAINVLNPPSDTGLTGAVGDGVTDDTSIIDAIMQYALVHNMDVYFPAATYLISTITITYTSTHKNLNIFGDGLQSKILVSGHGFIFLNTSEYSVPNYTKVENLKFSGAAGLGTRLLQFINIYNGLIQNCLFEYAENGLLLGSNIWCNIINCRFQGCNYDNVYMFGSAEDNRCLYVGNNAVNFIGCVSQNAGHDGFNCIGNSGCNFYGCTAEANGSSGIRLTKSGGFNGRGNLISGCWFEYNTATHIAVLTTDSAPDCNETISDCGFVQVDAQTEPSISINGTNGAVLVSGCHFRRISGSQKSMYFSNNLRCIHNRFSYTPLFEEIEAEHNDTCHAKIQHDATILSSTRDITSATKTATGTYRIIVNHWVRTVCASADGNGYTASCSCANQSDGTAIIDVVTRMLSNMADTDCTFSFIAM